MPGTWFCKDFILLSPLQWIEQTKVSRKIHSIVAKTKMETTGCNSKIEDIITQHTWWKYSKKSMEISGNDEHASIYLTSYDQLLKSWMSAWKSITLWTGSKYLWGEKYKDLCFL